MDLKSIEGHFKWLHELVPHIQKTAKAEEESLESYLKKILKGNITEVSALGQSLNEWSVNLAKKLNSVAMSVLTGETENVRIFLEQVDELLGNLDEATEIQCQIIKYCTDVLKQYGRMDDANAMSFNQKWEALIDTGGNEAKATISFLKGMLGLQLQIEDQVTADFLLEACQLDSSCLAWHHHAYRSIRRLRIKGRQGPGPTKMERQLATTAYQLDGKNVIAATDYGLMRKEMFKKQNETFCREHKDLYLECIAVFENALNFAEGDCLMKIKIYLAEFLYFGEGPVEDRMRGRDMFTELERDYPNSLAVLHKVGNLYRMGRNFQRARECYKRALEMEPTVVPCIMDYLELLKKEKDQTEILRVLKKALSPQYVRCDKDNAKLQRELEFAMGRCSEADLDDNWRR